MVISESSLIFLILLNVIIDSCRDPPAEFEVNKKRQIDIGMNDILIVNNCFERLKLNLRCFEGIRLLFWLDFKKFRSVLVEVIR